MVEIQKNYYAIIPADVRYDEDLTPNAKLLYSEITALCNERGYCWASNAYFAELYKVSKNTVSRWIQQLSEKGYIESKVRYKEGSNEVENRILTIATPIHKNEYTSTQKCGEGIHKNEYTPTQKCGEGIHKNEYTPPLKNEEDNNKIINNTVNNTFNNTKETDKDIDKHGNCRKRVYDESSVHFRLANMLYEKILLDDASFKKPNLNTWADHVRLMMERDGRTEEQIEYLINWSQQNSFWKSNILSTKKLREKATTLIRQIKAEREKERKPKYLRGREENVPEWFATRNEQQPTPVVAEIAADTEIDFEQERQKILAKIGG